MAIAVRERWKLSPAWKAEHRHEQDERRKADEDVDRILERQLPLEQRDRQEEARNEDRFLRVIEDPAELAEDELLGRDLGDEEQLEGLRVPLVRQRRHRLGVDEEQADERPRRRRRSPSN